MSAARTLTPAWVALATGALPLIGVGSSYLAGAITGHVPSCNPFLEGCTSISSTGRAFPGSLIFNAAMLSNAVLTVLFWVLSFHWLKSLGVRGGAGLAAIPVLGVIAGLFLVLYVSFLGTQGDVYAFLRRFGVTVYFGFTYLAQAFITRALWRLEGFPRSSRRAMFALLLAQLALGLTSVAADALRVDTDRVENILEWNFAMFMMLFFVAAAWAWRQTGFRLQPASGQP